MALLDLRIFPDPILREECQEVETVDDALRQALSDMAETMYEARGIGLAAPQVGRADRITVIDVGSDDPESTEPTLLKLINPVITAKDGSVDSEEGCLSIPDVRETLQRAERIQLEAYDENEKPIKIEADGLLAICIQHELDHLDGVLFIDHLSKLKRKLLLSKYKKLRANS